MIQRDKNPELEDDVYLWYHNTWLLADGRNYRAKNTNCWMYLNSAGKNQFQIHTHLIIM